MGFSIKNFKLSKIRSDVYLSDLNKGENFFFNFYNLSVKFLFGNFSIL